MYCISCIIAIVFFIANIYVTLSADKSKLKYDFYNTLSSEDIERYEKIVRERRNIYFKGYGLGLLNSLLFLLLNKSYKININNKLVVCVIGAITLLTNYFYYMLSPKSDYMIIHLNKSVQREQWLKINRYMQIRYHVGLILGIISSMFFANNFC